MQYVKHTVEENCLEAMQELSHDHWSYSTHIKRPGTRKFLILNSQEGHMQRTNLPSGINKL